jgi:hypothetical protein
MRNFTLTFFVAGLSCFVTPAMIHAAHSYPNFQDNPYLNDKMREMMAPYLLPVDHPFKDRLDSIFSQSRVTQNATTLVNAGFSIIAGPMPVSFIVVARHPEIPGYVFKIYLDEEVRSRPDIAHWRSLTTRCAGAKGIRKIIQREKIRHFAVPDKWLYVLPFYHFSSVANPQPVIVMETDMEPQGLQVTKAKWKTAVTREHLDELYAILKHGYGGNGTTILSNNVPFTKQGKFAFTDTESPKTTVNLKRIASFLSKDMARYWKSLLEKNS